MFLCAPIQKFLYISFFLYAFTGCTQINPNPDAGKDLYDGPEEIAQLEFEKTRDPATGRIPAGQLLKAMRYTDSLKKILPFQLIAGYGNWEERGPNSDSYGPSNGNTRANNGVTSGRIRAVLVDAADASGNTVFIGGVNGGIWKTTNITASPATWSFVNDFFSNMAVTGICQNPVVPATMYFCTGEWTFNFDAVAGDGIFKSTDGGATWTQLAGTTGTNFDYCSKILCDASGNVYVSTRTGVYRSNDGGTNWTTITPNGLSTSRFSDMEISSTGTLHVSAGQFSPCAYRYTTSPSTVTSATWTSSASFPTSTVRIELGCNGNILYALPSNDSYQVPTIYKSTDGGANWAATTGQPTAGWASGQAWYNLAVDIDGSGNVIVGALDPYKSTDGGTTWTKLADWTNNPGLPPVTTQYVHADIHFIKLYGTNRVLFGCDGGIHYSGDGGTTIRDRNIGLRIKQFFSVAIHPTLTNYFLAGAQDNGTHQLTSSGLGSSVEITGGDGAFVAIDQDQPQYQFGAYVHNNYRRSLDGGATWSSVNFNNNGRFINPWDYDNTDNKLYGSYLSGQYLRWNNPQGPQPGPPLTFDPISIPEFNSSQVSSVTVSPFTANRVYFGTAGGRVVRVDDANINSPVALNITGAGMPAGDVSCIATGTSDQYLMACYSNYGVASIWVSTDGGTSWTNIEGDLPDMPVRWCMFVPGNNNAAIIATEAGVYLTHAFSGGTTAWIPSPTFPTVRTDMLQYRPSDGLVAAATHGRGLWTQPYLSIVPATKFLLRGKWSGSITSLQWEYTKLTASAVMDIEMSEDAARFTRVGSVVTGAGQFYTFNDKPGKNNVYYRIKSTEASGLVKYSNTIKLFKSGSGSDLRITSLFPNPAGDQLQIGLQTGAGKISYAIHALNGQAIRRKEEDLQFTGNYIKTLNLAGIPAGNYLLTVSQGNTKTTKQFLKK